MFDLVSITKLEQQEVVKEAAKNTNTSHVWLGLCCSCALDLWLWVNDRLCLLWELDQWDRPTAATEKEKHELQSQPKNTVKKYVFSVSRLETSDI